ncbi:hypothetical protein [[Mycoplasma] testudinis]|uniref:hypothetical protein n=1 Tax=[Mycoplasma] testudinis TaxID=33924 RepID=UPI0004884B9B|nr:hypothetical protein [[Mycoplasma] testudinis]
MKKRIRYTFAFLGSAGLAAGIGLSFLGLPNNGSTSHNQPQLAPQSSSLSLSNQAAVTPAINSTIGQIRHSANNNFSGTQLADSGFAVLTGTSADQGYSATRTNSFGGVLWSFNPQAAQTSFAPGVQAVYNQQGIVANGADTGKGAIEIRQDSQLSNVFYVLLVPTQAIQTDANTELTTPTSGHTYADINSNVNLQATVVQIMETPGQENPYMITNVASIPPSAMVDNYPSQWKTPNGMSSFSKDQHPLWFDNNASSTMVLPWEMYITNLGNMFATNGTVLMFGGNGTVFNEPAALSIGMFRINFDTNVIRNNNSTRVIPKLTGIPYAYILAGITSGPNSDSNFAFTNAPLGQDATFSYVPRMAVGGVQGAVGNIQTGNYIYIAGSITVGQDITVQKFEGGLNSTIVGAAVESSSMGSGTNNAGSLTTPTSLDTARGLGSLNDPNFFNNTTATNQADDGGGSYDPAGENGSPRTRFFRRLNDVKSNNIPSLPQLANATTGNSVNPLSVFGTQLNIASLLNIRSTASTTQPANTPSAEIDTLVSGDNSWLYSLLNSSSYSLGVNPGFASAFLSQNSDFGTLNHSEDYDRVSRGSIVARPQQLWDSGLGMFTSLFGYSPKDVGNLASYSSNGAQDGYVMQIGAFTYYFSLSGSDGYVQNQGMTPVVDTTPQALPTDPTTGTDSAQIGSDNANKWWTLQMMPQSAYSYNIAVSKQTRVTFVQDATPAIGNNPLWINFVGTATTNGTLASATSFWGGASVGSTTLINNFSGSANIPRTQYQNFRNGSMRVNGNSSGNFAVTVNTGTAATTNNAPTTVLQSSVPTSVFAQKGNSGLSILSFSPTTLRETGSFTNAASDITASLGSGEFNANPPESFTTLNVNNIFDTVTENGVTLNLLKSNLISSFFTYHKPTLQNQAAATNNGEGLKIRIVVTNINPVDQSATFTAQVQNPLNPEQWDIIPSSNGVSNQNFPAQPGSFNRQPSYVIAVAVAVPIIAVAIIIGLGLGIGIPMQKNKKALKQGFEISNKKVDTLTTAVGSVFKQIINRTQIGNIKKSPQLLKKASPSPAAKPAAPGAKPVAPSAKPAAPAHKPVVPTAKPAAPSAPTKPASPTKPTAPSKPANPGVNA